MFQETEVCGVGHWRIDLEFGIEDNRTWIGKRVASLCMSVSIELILLCHPLTLSSVLIAILCTLQDMTGDHGSLSVCYSDVREHVFRVIGGSETLQSVGMSI